MSRERGLKVCQQVGSDRELKHGRPTVDIVFVHGLNGDRLSTWSKDGVFWPLDLLGPIVPHARIMTFGYNADFLSTSTYGIRDHAKKLLTSLRDKREELDECNRPLVFVCHSMGGLVAKQALLTAAIDQEYSSISEHTQGVVFMGTPHRGPSLAKWASVLAAVAKVAFLTPKKEFLDLLKKNGNDLLELSEDFVRIAAKYSFKSFYEENRVRGIPLVVDKDSSTMNITQEESIPIEGNHMDMCRFSRPDDEGFEAVWKAIKRLIPQVDSNQLSNQQEQLLASLSAVDPEDMLDGIEEPFANTVRWILDEKLPRWLTSTENHVMHIFGPPGYGKTVLAAFLYRSGLRNISKFQPLIFTFQDRIDSRSASSAWSTLMHQLLLADSSLFPTITSESGMAGGLNKLRPWRESRLRQVFEKLATQCRHPTVYVIDALDQADGTRDKILSSLSQILENKSRAPIKILLISRPDQETLSAAGFSDIVSVDLDEEQEHEQSVCTFIKEKVGQLCKKRRGFVQCDAMITEKLIFASKGMYLLPVMAVESLKSVQGTEDNIRGVLDRLPDSLLGAYRSALDLVHPEHRALTCAVLSWVVFSMRPLAVKELSSAVALSSNPDDYLPLRSNISFDLLGDRGVVELVGPLLKIKDKGDNQIVCLAHHSVREFLLNTKPVLDDSDLSAPQAWLLEGLYGKSSPRPIYLHYSEIHGKIFRYCLRYLQISAKSEASVNGESVGDSAGSKPQEIQLPKSWGTGTDESTNFPLLTYCFENCHEHVREVASESRSFANFLSTGLGSHWIARFWSLKDPSQNYGKQEALHFAAAVGLTNVVEMLLSMGHKADSRDDWGNTVLDVAASTGVVATMKFLVEKGKADLHASQKAGQIMPRPYIRHPVRDPTLVRQSNVLHTAVYYGHVEATEYLLRAEADPTRLDHERRTPMDIAAAARNKQLVNVLFRTKSTAKQLHAAIERDCLETMKFLIEELGVDPCLPLYTEDYWSPLKTAADYDALQCAKYLATLPAVLTKENQMSSHAFHFAVRASSSRFVNFFLDQGLVDDNIVNKEGQSVLHLACEEGNYNMATLLLKHNINMALTDENGRHALEVLLSPGARVNYLSPATPGQERLRLLQLFKDPTTRNACPGNGGNFLHALSGKIGDPEEGIAMKTLLDWNLDPGETDNDGRTVLHLAARATDERFDILIDRMINVNQQDNTGQTALHILASMFKAPLERVDRLLQKGANVKICDHEGKTALHVAAGKNNWQLKRFLEFKGAINQPDKLGLTPFHYLLKDPYYYYNTGTDTCSVLESLLENGADIAAQDNEGRTSLHMAAKYGDRRLDQLLKMDLSKCINIRDGRGQTPLHALLTAPESPRLAENIRRLIENGQTLTHELATTKVF